MTRRDEEVQKAILRLLSSQQLAALSTQDLKYLVVATGKATRKHHNILHDGRVSLLIDNRSNSEDDFHAAQALTVLGRAHPVEAFEHAAYQDLYLRRHPYLEKFLTSPTTAFIKVEVYHYLLVSRFQKVMEYNIRDDFNLFS